ncbi:MAG: glycerol-3-phosphate acyltransferase [Ignavibacterium sp.]|jgi:glycerol-3-phosphate acyltransferase PlsY|nr:glycerol-3-phosphate acyltransferase [Ignavibacterium sp.]
MEYLLSSIIGYLFGSIPTAYLLLKKAKGIDITTSGTGNVGAMNSYEVTNSKLFGLIVLLVDFLKGLIPALFVLYVFEDSFFIASLAVLFAIFSHCFNPWLNFKGGRGLATAAGGSAVIFPFLPVAWIIFYLIVYVIKKDIHTANIFATVLSLISVLGFHDQVNKFANPQPVLVNELLLFTSAGLLIIFIKHIEPLKEIISNKQK